MKNKVKLIFDLDGMIIESQVSCHSFIEANLLREYMDVIISKEELAKRYASMATRKVFSEMAPGCDVEFLFNKKWERMYELVSKEGIECLPEIYELISDLKRNGHEITVASASQPKWVELCLKHARPYGQEHTATPTLFEIFDGKYFSAGSCAKNKPDPDMFLLADDSFKDIFGPTYVVGDGEGDVLGGLAAGFPVLYLSSDTKFDSNTNVYRFNNSNALATHVRKYLM